MTYVEKIGLLVFIMGAVTLTALFILGGGDADAAFRNGKQIQSWFRFH